MDTDQLKKELQGLPLAIVEYHPCITSSNDRAAELVDQGAAHLSLVVADEQTRGRGRGSRTWFTPPGEALAFSLVLRPENLLDEAVSRCTGLGALAVCRAIEKIYDIPAVIKWPNDVLLGWKKVCGVLAEAFWLGDRLDALVLGIGINVASGSVPTGGRLNFPATSLETALNKQVDRWQLLAAVLQNVIYWWQRLSESVFIQSWEQHLAFIGEQVQFFQDDGLLLNGTPLGLESNGWLRIQTAGGEKTSIQMGEIQLRPFVDS